LLTAYFYFEDLFPVSESKAVDIVLRNLELQELMLYKDKKEDDQEEEE
jgi:hypothetical protein